MASTYSSYPGDEAFKDFLIGHHCPLSLKTVKFRIWGQVTTIAMTLSPLQEIQSIWNNELPTFDNEDESKTFFETMMSLWNMLAEMNMTGKRLTLSQRTGLGDLLGLTLMVERRLDELDSGFLTGFIADMRPFDDDEPKVSRAISKLVDLIDGLEEIMEALDEADPDHGELRTGFIRLDNKAQQRLDAVVRAANAFRGITTKTAGIH